MELQINTGIPEDQVEKVVHQKGLGHIYVELFYPNGLMISYDRHVAKWRCSRRL